MKYISLLKKFVGIGRSTSPALQIKVFMSLVMIFSLTQFAPAKDTTGPGQFELLLPASNATTYAAVYGDTPILAWAPGSDKCLKAAQRCYSYFTKTWPVVTDYETKFSARPYMETVTISISLI